MTRTVADPTDVLGPLAGHLSGAVLGTDGAFLTVASARRGEGRTTTCAAAALALAACGFGVLAVDADLGRPALHEALAGHNHYGLTDVLADRMTVAEARQPITAGTTASLELLSAGSVTPGSAVLRPLRRTLRELGAGVDAVVVDTPPLFEGPESSVATSIATAALVVVREGVTRTADLARVRSTLGQAGIVALGIVFHTR